MSPETLITKLSATPGVVYRLLASALGLGTVIALVPDGPNSVYAVLQAVSEWFGADRSDTLAAVQAWMQDPSRADTITEFAAFGAAVGVWLGVAQTHVARDTFAAPSSVLLVAVAVAAGGAVPWELVISLPLALIAAAIHVMRKGDAKAIETFLLEVTVAMLYVPLLAYALLYGGGSPSRTQSGAPTA